jgi:hypothetical protein
VTTSAIDVVAVRADDQLVEDIRAGHTPGGDLAQYLAALRDFAIGGQQ